MKAFHFLGSPGDPQSDRKAASRAASRAAIGRIALVGALAMLCAGSRSQAAVSARPKTNPNVDYSQSSPKEESNPDAFFNDWLPGDARINDTPSDFKIVPGQERMFQRILEYQRRKFQNAPQERKAYWAGLNFSSAIAYENSLGPYRNEFMNALGIPYDLRSRQEVSLASSRFVRAINGVNVYRWVLTIGDGLIQSEALVGIPQNRKRPLPAVIGFYGAAGSPERVFGLDGVQDYHKSFALRLASQGYLVYVPYLVIDFKSIQTLDASGFELGTRIMGTEVGLAMRAVDYLTQRNDVNPLGISVFGISYGGLLASYLGAADPRIAVTIDSGGFTDADAVYQKLGSPPIWFRLNAGIPRFTPATIAYMIAPRGFFVERGSDDGFDLYRVADAFNEVKAVYRRLGSEEKAGIQRGKGAHEVYLQDSLRFLKNLSPPAAPLEGGETGGLGSAP